MTKKDDASNATLVQKLSRPVSWKAFKDVMTHEIQFGSGQRKLDFADLDGEAEKLLQEARRQSQHSGQPIEQILSNMGVLSKTESADKAANRRELLDQLGWQSLSGEWSAYSPTDLPALPTAEDSEPGHTSPIQWLDEVVGLRRLQTSLSYMTLDELGRFLLLIDAKDEDWNDQLLVCKVISAEDLKRAQSAYLEEGEQAPFWLVLLSCGAQPERFARLIESASWYPIIHPEKGDFADHLAESGKITFRQFKAYMSERSESKRPTEETLAEWVGPIQELTEELSRFFSVSMGEPDAFPVVQELGRSRNLDLLRVFNVVPVEWSTTPVLGAKRPLSSFQEELLTEALGPFEFVLLGFVDYEMRRAAIHGQLLSSRHIHRKERSKELGAIREMITNASAVRLVEDMFERALDVRATDIHLERQKDHFRVRFRVDGLLQNAMNIHPELADEVTSRIKILAGMDITEKRQPQDGHIKVSIAEQDVFMRVAIVPTYQGERISIRLLNSGQVQLSLEDLGLEGHDLQRLDALTRKPYGMILTTGPVGSGKTTSLYSALARLNTPERNIITIEDPVEYEMEGINQIEVNYRIQLGFVEGLRSILRQDPNAILVGEIRDHETASIAIRASMTGLLVLSSLHTNDAAGAITTFHNFQLPPLLIANALLGVVAQRLVRKLCNECKELYTPSSLEMELFEERNFNAGTVHMLARPVGCEACYFTGYRGRTGIFELMEITPDIRELILEGVSERVIREAAIQNGMTLLSDAALQKVQAHVTSLDEIRRVVFL